MAFLKLFTSLLKTYGDFFIYNIQEESAVPEQDSYQSPVAPTTQRRRSSFVSWKSAARRPSMTPTPSTGSGRRQSLVPIREKEFGNKDASLFVEVTDIPDTWFDSTTFLESLDRETKVCIMKLEEDRSSVRYS